MTLFPSLLWILRTKKSCFFFFLLLKNKILFIGKYEMKSKELEKTIWLVTLFQVLCETFHVSAFYSSAHDEYFSLLFHTIFYYFNIHWTIVMQRRSFILYKLQKFFFYEFNNSSRYFIFFFFLYCIWSYLWKNKNELLFKSSSFAWNALFSSPFPFCLFV